MHTSHETSLATSIIRRWDHVLDVEIAARRGDEKALRIRENTGLRNWFK